MRVPELIAHRGYAARFPENTLPALEAAAAAGARFVEVDVQLSADGVPVLFHDRGLRRMCAVSGAVHPGPVGWHALGGVIKRWRQRATLKSLRPEYLFCAVDGLPRAGEIRFPGARIAVYEVASAVLALYLHRRGVQMIETFAIGELKQELDDLSRLGESVQ